MNFVGAILTFLCSLLAFAAPRRFALLGVVAASCYITQGQEVAIIGFHFTSMRLVLLVAFARCIVRGELRELEVNRIDKGLFAFVVVSLIVYLICAGGVMKALVYGLGWSYNLLMSYMVFRCLMSHQEEIQDFIAYTSILIIPFTVCLMLEAWTGNNVFTAMGGVGTMFRDGHFRAEAAFRSPITAGTFGATLMPFFVGLYMTGRKRGFACVGMVATTVIVICSRSSGPLLACGAGVLGFLFWRYRENMRLVRRIVLVTMVSLHLYMKAPIWFLMGRISDVVGGGGWHRAYIVDEAVKHFGSWWLCGTLDTGDWMPTQITEGGADLTNEFVAAGVRGGLVSLIILIMIFVMSFGSLGRAMQKIRGVAVDTEWMLWSLGASLFATLVNFFSVSYFDQIHTIWMLLLAMISSLAFGVLNDDSHVSDEEAVVDTGEFKVEQDEGGTVSI